MSHILLFFKLKTISDSEAGSGALWGSGQALPVGVLACVASLVLLGMALMVCMDCMNSEVSSDSHPASSGDTPKWGGASNYSRAGGGQGGRDSAYVTEVVNPDDLRNAPLPYSMVPTQIPESGEFRGYQTSGGNSGMAGYSATTPSAPSPAAGYSATSSLSGYGANDRSGNHGRHYNPGERDDPPPAYSEAAGH